DGILPTGTPDILKYAIRAVMYADSTVSINEPICEKIKCMSIADIPNAGYDALPDDPLTSILCSGGTREEVMGNTLEMRSTLKDIFK
ncbi:MAG: hypothetical protein K8R01_04140, partial [Methanococcoides sp.]|nr:hypothetical protein [Methanococcoides sp.]